MANEINVYVGGTAGNTTTWKLDGNWSAGHEPADGTTENAIVAKDTAYGITGVDDDAYELGSLTVEQGYGSGIGTRAVPLMLQTQTVRLLGGSYVYLTITHASDTTFYVANCSNVNLIDACKVTNFNQASGTCRIPASAVTVAIVSGGRLIYGDPGKGAVAITTLTINDTGTVEYNSNQTITTLNLRKGTLDLSKDSRAETVTTLNLWPGGKILDPAKRLTVTTLAPQAGGTLSLS
jgi:hypothetical protein